MPRTTMPNDWNAELENIGRQRKYAELLRQQSMDPLKSETAGGYVVPINPLQGLAKMLQAYGGRRGEEIATEQSRDLVSRRNKALAETLRGAFEPVAIPGKEAQMGEMGETVEPAVPATSRARTPQEISQALLANPDTMNLGGQMMIKSMASKYPSSLPSNISEWEYYNKLSPNDQSRFLEMKRNPTVMNLGGSMAVRQAGGGIGEQYGVTLKPGELPSVRRAQAEAAALGKDTGEKKAELSEMEANLPRLETVVTQLSDLGKTATYTKTGQAQDVVRRELGMEPRPEAVARKEYIAKVDNEILPLLRLTFGAQFTEREGQSLKATLGDPNVSPAEKDAVLRSFIDSKRAQINTKRRGLGASPAGGGMGPTTKTIGGKTYIKQNGQWFEQ